MSQHIPQPYYTLINTSRGDNPAIVVINSALRDFKNRKDFPWHLLLTIDCQLLGDNGMPTADEVAVLNELEEKISPRLQQQHNAIFLARITCRGQRELIYRVHDPDMANSELKSLIETPAQPREWEYRIERDDDWSLAEEELALVERDRRIN